MKCFAIMLFLFLIFGIVGSLDYNQAIKEESWANGTQAAEMRQERIEIEILEGIR